VKDDRDVFSPAILSYLASSVVLPIACGLVSGALYDTIKRALSSKKTSVAIDALIDDGQRRDGKGSSVDASKISTGIVGPLTNSGVPEKKAAEIVEACLQRLRART